jgi:hypothetical protein
VEGALSAQTRVICLASQAARKMINNGKSGFFGSLGVKRPDSRLGLSRWRGGGRDFGRLQESQRNFIRLMFLKPKFGHGRLFYNTFDLERFRLARLRIVTYAGSEMML